MLDSKSITPAPKVRKLALSFFLVARMISFSSLRNLSSSFCSSASFERVEAGRGDSSLRTKWNDSWCSVLHVRKPTEKAGTLFERPSPNTLKPPVKSSPQAFRSLCSCGQGVDGAVGPPYLLMMSCRSCSWCEV